MIDVLIIGAGPTGLMMAGEAARHGLSCRIVDKGSFHMDVSRAVGIQARTMEIFGQLGIAKKFLEQGIRVKAADPISHSCYALSIEKDMFTNGIVFL